MSAPRSRDEARQEEPAPARSWRRALSSFEWLVLALGLALGVQLRVAGVAGEALMGDELHFLGPVEQGYGEILSIRNPVKYLGYVGFALLQRLAVDVLGPSVFSFRFPAIACGVLGLVLLFPLGWKLVGPRPAWLATLALAIHPMHVYYSRFARGYTLTVLLSLLLVACLVRARPAPGEPARARGWLAFALVGGLLAFVHPLAVGFVAALALPALQRAWGSRERLRETLKAAGGFVGAALLYLALLEPVRAELVRYMGGKTPAQDPNSVVGIVTLLGGGLVAGFLQLALGGAACALLLRERTWEALVLIAALAGPALTLFATQPVGMDYTYSRYLIGSLPFLLLAAAWGVDRLASALPARRFVPAAVGLALLAAYGASGPLWGHGLRRLQFTQNYLALHDLPAFDLPFDQTPEFYRELAARGPGLRLVECPVTHGSSLLLRNYALQHGQQALVGLQEAPSPILRSRPYVWVDDAEALAASGADYLILHMQISREANKYARFVAEQAEALDRPQDQNLVQKFLDDWSVSGEALGALPKKLRRRYGEPVFRDPYIQVWSLGSDQEGTQESDRLDTER